MKKKIFTAAVAAAALTGCASGPSVKTTAMNAPYFMSEEVTIERQRPANPATVRLKWAADDRLYKALTLDYVSGLSQRSYFFEEANRAAFDPMLGYALHEANLLAPTNLSGRYALQIDFLEIDTDFIGLDYAGKSVANYRIVDRATGRLVYQKEISSNFLAVYPRLNEDDASKAYDISAPGVRAFQAVGAAWLVGDGILVEQINNNSEISDFFNGPINEASQTVWNNVTQTYVWGTALNAVSGPAIVALEHINPLNFLSLKFSDQNVARNSPVVRNGPLSEWGLGARDGAERARQVNAQMLAQSIAIFIADLSTDENIEIVHILPCSGGAATDDLWLELLKSGKQAVSDDCMTYVGDEQRQGLGLPTWK